MCNNCIDRCREEQAYQQALSWNQNQHQMVLANPSHPPQYKSYDEFMNEVSKYPLSVNYTPLNIRALEMYHDVRSKEFWVGVLTVAILAIIFL